MIIDQYGLKTAEALEKLAQIGKNELDRSNRASLFSLFFKQFKDALLIILLVAVLISFMSGENLDAIVILAIVLLNAILGFIQENKAEKTMDALRKLGALQTKVGRLVLKLLRVCERN